MGKLTYLFIALKHVLGAKNVSGSITIDHQTYPLKRLLFAAAQNHRYEGGGFMFCPDAKPDDDILDLIYVDGVSKLKLLGELPFAKKGKHTGFKDINLAQCEEFSLKIDKPLPLHTDGEYVGDYTEVQFSLRPHKIQLIT